MLEDLILPINITTSGRIQTWLAGKPCFFNFTSYKPKIAFKDFAAAVDDRRVSTNIPLISHISSYYIPLDPVKSH